MATIIKHGKDKIKKITCRQCDCDISYKNEDVFDGLVTIIDFKLEAELIKCPNCGNKIQVV